MHASTLVYLNYDIDPSRRPAMLGRLERELSPLGYRVATELTAEHCAAVGLLVNKTRELADEDLQRFPNLQGIILWGTQKWMLSFDEAAHPLDIRLLDVDRGVEVAEHALALLLAGLKGLPRLRPWRRLLSPRQLYRSLFPRTATESAGAHNWTAAHTGTLYRKKVGIIGYGLIGRQIHRRLQGFACQVFYYHSRRYSSCVEQRLAMSYLGVPEMFAECDAVFVQLPLTPATSWSRPGRGWRWSIAGGRASSIKRTCTTRCAADGLAPTAPTCSGTSPSRPGTGFAGCRTS